MNRDFEIQRLTVDLHNTTDYLVMAEASYNSATPVLHKASNYTAVVESATIDLSSMVLNPAPDFKILIFNNDKTGKYTNLPNQRNLFVFNEQLIEVSEMIDWLYNVTHKAALPADLGDFEVDSEGYFTYEIKEASAFSSGDIEVYFNSNLCAMLPQFISSRTATHEGSVYYRFDISSPVTPRVKQAKYTLSKLMTAVSIRFYTDLQTTSHLVHKPNLNTIVRENIFATIALNNETFDVLNKYNMVYSPQQYRHVTMNNDESVQSFRIWVKVYYKSGVSVYHMLKPGDYSVINIAFYPREGHTDGVE